MATPRAVARPTEFRIMAALLPPPPPSPSVDQGAARIRVFDAAYVSPTVMRAAAGDNDDTMLGPGLGKASIIERRVHGKQQPRLATRGRGRGGDTRLLCARQR